MTPLLYIVIALGVVALVVVSLTLRSGRRRKAPLPPLPRDDAPVVRDVASGDVKVLRPDSEPELAEPELDRPEPAASRLARSRGLRQAVPA